MLYFGNREPPLEEVFDDPIVRLLMVRDRLPADEARARAEGAARAPVLPQTGDATKGASE